MLGSWRGGVEIGAWKGELRSRICALEGGGAYWNWELGEEGCNGNGGLEGEGWSGNASLEGGGAKWNYGAWRAEVRSGIWGLEG